MDRSFILSLRFLGPHLYRSTIFLSVWVQFELGPHLYQSVIHLVSSVFGVAPISIDHLLVNLCSVWVGTAPISIGHSSCQFEFSGPHLYLSTIFLLACVQFELGPYLYRSIIVHVSLSLVWDFSGTHLYRSFIQLVSSIWVLGTTPVSISHCPC